MRRALLAGCGACRKRDRYKLLLDYAGIPAESAN